MNAIVTSGPCHVEEALFGIGLSYGLTANMNCNQAFRNSPTYRQLEQVSKKLAHKQGGHNKFLETITLTLDIIAPRYWWQEFDTYRVGVTKQSESTMHTIMSRDLACDDFEGDIGETLLNLLNSYRRDYVDAEHEGDEERKREAFLALKALLPEGFLQRRIVCLNARTLQNMYLQRKNHRLPEWRELFDAIAADLGVSPYADLMFWYIFHVDTEGE